MPMKFLFWQNMISIHQTALLNAFASKHQVTLAVQRAFEEERTDSGWKIPDMGNVHLELSPDEQRIHQLILSNETAIHVFSGIDAYPMVFRAFKQCIQLKRTTLIYMEPYQTGGISGQLRRLKYALLYLKYGNSACKPTGAPDGLHPEYLNGATSQNKRNIPQMNKIPTNKTAEQPPDSCT